MTLIDVATGGQVEDTELSLPAAVRALVSIAERVMATVAENDALRGELRAALSRAQAAADAYARPKVLVTIRDGIGWYDTRGDVDVELIDFDELEHDGADGSDTPLLSAAFAAAFPGIDGGIEVNVERWERGASPE